MEKLHIKVGLSGTFWKKHPKYQIFLNNIPIIEKEIEGASGELQFIQFDSICVGETSLKIRLVNKEDSDTVENETKTEIIHDMLLNIHSVIIDGVDVNDLLHTHSEYHVDGSAQVIKNCINLGWNGTWILTWGTPFYQWLLDTL